MNRGGTLFEVACALSILAVLGGVGFYAVQGVRSNAQCTAVAQHLKSIHAALELYYNKYHQYPSEQAPLKESLAEFVSDPALWADPADSTNQDQVSATYRPPAATGVVSARVLGSPCGGMKYVALYPNGLVKITEVEAKCPDVSDTGSSGGSGGSGGAGSEGGTPDTPPPVVVSDGGATLKQCKAYVRVVGTDFTYSDGTHVYSSATAFLDGTPKLVGDPATVGTGFEQEVPEGTRVTMRCEIKDAYMRQSWQANGWPVVFTSDDHSGQCLTVVRGDQVPVYAPGYACQQPVHVLLSEYIDPTGAVIIKPNEVLWLFDENWVGDDPQKLDYNDLVVLATARATSDSGEGEGGGGGTQTVIASNTDAAGFTIALKNKIENADGTISLVWTITSDSSTSTPALSYLVFDLPSNTRTLAKNTCYCSKGNTASVVNPDSGTGARGIKIAATNLGSSGVETMTVAFKVYTGTTAVTVKTKPKSGSTVGSSSFNL